MDLKARIVAVSWAAALILAALQQLSSAEHSDEHEELEYVHNTELCEEPLPPLNGELQCGRHKVKKNRLVCRATCDDGFQFPDGKKKRKNFCNMDNGKWNEYLIPDCDPICDPPCENGGRCNEENNCVCAVGFRGKRCEYSYGLCDPSQVLDVAGSWKCNHTSSETQCVLNCPQGTQFETQPADLYRCSIEGVWTPNFAPKCLPINVIEPPSSHGMFPSSTGLKHQARSSDMCATWSQLHYRTYDGGMYSFQGKCTYLLSKDCSDGTFAIHVDNSGPCDSPTNCQNKMIIYVGNEEYVLTDSPSGPVIVHREQIYVVPSSIGGMIFQFLSDYPYVSLTSSLGFRLMWNSRGTVLLKMNNQMKNKTCGLCGRFDGSVLNDFEMADGVITDNVEAFVNSWTMNDIESQCSKGAVVEHPCNSVERSHAEAATEVCEKIKDARFSACHYLVDPQPYYEACRMDYCACSEPNYACVCNSFEEYFRECGRLGGKVEGGWRTEQLCPRNCPENMIYEDCGSSCPLTCRNTVYNCEDEHCVGGCHCPEGTVLYQNKCIPKTTCPCTHNGKDYEHGARITQECNACECLGGKWECTKETCEARCSSVGDPHYTTFDGVQYEFLGSCPYYLVYHENFTIIQESGPCPKSLESAMEGEHSAESAFCTRSITVNYGESVLVLKPNTQPMFNDKGISSYPFAENGLKIDVASSMFVKVELSYGVSLMWDGKNRIYIDASPSLYGKTKGLCGTFNHNQNDDFVTPDGDVEADVLVFTSRWKASDVCHKRSRRNAVSPTQCSIQPQKLPDAKHLCNLIKSEIFEACHNEVDPDPFYRRCVEDLCACTQDLEECLCDSLSDYGAACARIGTVVDWAQNVAACMPRCENGQVYQECGNPCKFSCLTIATSEYCQESCVQGCACPDGMTLNSDGFCIPRDQCPCVHESKEYTAKSAKLQGTSMCECVNAEWVCHPASLNELVHLGNDMMTLGKTFSCNENNNEEFTQCLSSCRPTCQNLRLPPDCLSLDCKAGCKCKEGYVMDEDLEQCVKLSECGCRHGHRKYAERSKIQKDCNLCTCEQGAWICTEKVCPGICSVWGESHFKTFDGRIFDFHGDCDYVLAKTALELVEFSLRVRNVPCGTSGITCSKSFTLELGNGDKVTLSRDEPLPKLTYGSRLLVSEVGLFVSVYTDIGITLRWDKGTRMYITVDPQWQGKITGLCGNFNNDQSDDFLSPFGGIPEARPTLFADSWKIEETCSASKTIDDACALHPDRQGWAIKQCSTLKSDLFSACHSEVALQPFFERCVFDTCACDIGGDCECLCTSIAAYAQECNVHGVHIKWRTQELCPIQCEECATYESCMSSCPVRTCDTQLIYENIDCLDESCIEGCNPKPCPPGQIFNNARELKCIPQADCVIPCREINGKMYYEGERITDPDVVDTCQSCHCLRGDISCSGQPCPKIVPIIPLPPAGCEQTGWTPWLNTPKIIGGDFENLNSIALYNVYSDFCGLYNITDIECRVTESKVPYEETGQTVSCSIPHGLVCKDKLQNSELCEDYEIRLFCDCGPLTTIATTTVPPVTERVVPPMCQAPGWTYWMNAYTPDEKGDFETIRSLRKSRIFCPDNEIDDIQCRKAGTRKQYDEQDSHIKCDKDVGLECVNTNDYRCDDYEIRFYCVCSYTECDYPRGMKNGNIKPTQILVSSYRTESTNGNSGRVNGQSAWSSSNVEQSQWIQVDLEEEQEITGVYTQGSPLADEWVTAFKLTYSHDGSRFSEVKDVTGNVQVFEANNDQNTPVFNTFPTFFARYVRLIPLEWHNWISLRVELLGCIRDRAIPRSLVPQECKFPGWTNWINSYSADSKGDFETKNHIMWSRNICPENEIEDIQCRSATTGRIYDSEDPHIRCNIDTGLICMNTNDYDCDDYEVRFYCKCSETVCEYPRGMERENIKDSQIVISSFWMEDTDGRSSRLNGKSAWKPGNLEFQQWIQVDLEEQQEITGIVTQGNPAAEEWVTLYKVSYSNDDETFSFVQDLEGNPQIFVANKDSDTAVSNTFSPIYARYIRIIPVEWHKWIGLRLEILGCNRKAPLTTTPTVPSCIPGWTDYFNVDTPESEGDNGDEETIDRILESHREICKAGNIQKAECVSYQEGKYIDYMKTGQIGLKCSRNRGFICINDIQDKGEKCHDYMIRFYCSCEEVTTPTIITETTPPTTTTTEITTTISPCPPGEVYDRCAYHCEQTCLSFLYVLHENEKCLHEDEQCIEGCRPAHGCDQKHLWRDFATCVPRDECTCVLPDGTQLAPKQVVQLKECEKCQCVDNSLLCLEMPQCATVATEEYRITTLGYVTKIENADCWTDWINIDSPDRDVGDLEVLSKIRNRYEFCSDPVEIECRRADNKQKASDTGQNVRCELMRGLHCWTSENENGCHDYEIRFFCPCVTVPPSTTLLPSTVPPAPCEHGWTEWFNKHVPGSIGEYETIQSVRAGGGYFCSSDMITAIECRKTSAPEPYTLQHKVLCDLEVGLMCRNSDLDLDESCSDYEARFFCDCPTSTVTTTVRPTTTTVTSAITTIPAAVPCSHWSDWINENHPDGTALGKGSIKKGSNKSKVSNGDVEKRTLFRLQQEDRFCLDGELTAIECRTAETDLDFTESDDLKLACTLAKGFRCRSKDQRDGVCQDYKIRYFCTCKEVSTTTVIITTSTLPPPPCFSYYNVVDGPFPFPDSNLRASTSRDSSSGPQNARLSSVQGLRSSGAWIAGTLDSSQYLELDLGRIQPVYGVVTKGRAGTDEWVESYYVLFSRDGVAFSYVHEEPDFKTKKEFPGNYDGDSLVKHVFAKPFEAQYVRIQPVTYNREIALRADVLGCAEGITTTKATTTPMTPICTDEMGMENGNISDSQITVSSVRGPDSGPAYVRLNTIQSAHQTGGWVADILDENQYVQIDFVEPRNITGIITQGRELVSQWVESYKVLYSQDDDVWNTLTDEDGIPKVFRGNFDSDTTVKNFFPRAIRTQYVRIIPLTWNNWISMRLEVLGCFEPYEEIVKEHSILPPTVPTFGGCFSQMGFESGKLPNSFISVSSFSSSETDASRIRLGTKRDENGAGGWASLPLDKSPYVLIDFQDVRNITGIITQGRSDADMWVTSYTVQYSLDDLEWKYCTSKEDKSTTFSGNVNPSSILPHHFTEMVEARFVKITVVSYHESPAMRMELLGCFEPYVEKTTPVTITTTEFCIEYSQWISLSEPSFSANEEEPIEEIIQHLGSCTNPLRIQCRTVATKTDYTKAGQSVTCDLTHGLSCKNDEQPFGYCKNYEVRIGCWTCAPPVTTTLRPLVLCPETPLSLMERCPVSCPPDHACDGTSCIHHIDCPCFQEEKRFNASDRTVTSDCSVCDCILEGHSKCKPMTCPDCLEGQKSELTKDCKCICTGCPIGTELCPTNGQCLESKLWCDGIEDCPDDEIGCPTTPVPTTTTVTPAPPTCSPEMQLETVTCEMTANLFSTFDGLEYQYDICNHVLMKDKEEDMFEVTVHKECLSDQRTCSRYVEIYVDGTEIKLGPGARDMYLDGYKIPIGNLWWVTKRYPNFIFRKEGNNLVVSSLQYNFTVTWDPRQDTRITMSKCSTRNVVGLCGFYNGNYDDDRLKPDGSLASGNEEFGNSWSIGNEEYCIPPKCPIDIMTLAHETCKELSEIPFSNCSSYLNTESQTAACISYMCECLQQESEKTITDSTDMCKCNAYESFVEACEKSSNGHRLEWRLKYGCAPVCPPGMEWHECGPGCELTCDNYRNSEEICSDQCIPGCYCPSGLVRHQNKCIKPKLCQDCVCRGHGDPNYITFDGHYYAFQGNCTYVLAQHQKLDKLLDFQVLGINIECPEEPHTSCTDGVKIFWNGHTIMKFKNQPVTLDGIVMKTTDFPYEDESFTISYVPRKNMVVHVKDINLVVRYFDQIYAFNVELPSYVYFNQTEGLCGICNFIESDDMYHKDGYITDNVDDFAYSWLVENTRDECTLPRVPVTNPVEPKICNFTRNRCELFMDPMFYSKACMNDITYSTNAKASMCRSKIQYAQQCCEKGISLTEWLNDSGCLLSCDEGMLPECSTSCQKTCDNYKDYNPNDCSLSPLLTCSCPPDKVFQFGKCVDPQVCEICDDEGHVVGDEWDNGPCEHCTCLENRIVRCHVQTCAEPPICTEEEKLEVLPQHEAACCPIYRCIPIPKKQCPSAPVPECQPGQVVKVSIVDDCQVYDCACDEKLCPPLVHPTSVEEGEEFVLVQKGCCREYESQCIPENCHDLVKCGPGFKLSTFEGKCCTKSTCVPKKNVCVYHHQFEVVNGTELQLSPEQYFDKEYEAGSSWNEGLCRTCSCVESDNQFSYKCTIEICPDPSQFPDADIYYREREHIPGMCCPTYHRVQCVSEGVKYSVNEEWPSPDGNKCKKYRCIESGHGEVTRMEKTTICNVNCPEYAVYVEPGPESPLCCGYCKPVGCEENGKIYEGGATWKSESKPCFTGECIISENMTQIMYRSEKCPPFPKNCPPKDVIFDATGCCQLCKKEPEIPGVCAPIVIPEFDTRQFFLISDEERGICSNYNEVKNLTVCSGKCGSDLVYSKERDDFEGKCKCCIPDNIVKREITLDCDDRSQIKKIYQQPTTCHCSSCNAEGELPFVGPVVY